MLVTIKLIVRVACQRLETTPAAFDVEEAKRVTRKSEWNNGSLFFIAFYGPSRILRVAEQHFLAIGWRIRTVFKGVIYFIFLPFFPKATR